MAENEIGLSRVGGAGAHGARLALATLCVCVAWQHVARAQGVLPASGADVQVGDLRDAFGGLYDRTPASQSRTITYTPSIDVSQTLATGAPLNDGRSGTELVTQVTPGIAVVADTLRVHGSLYYAPSLDIYETGGGQTQVQQNLNGAATITVAPNLLFIDLRGYASENSLIGGRSETESSFYNGEAVSSESFSIAPYLKHEFADTSVVIVGYSLARTVEDTNTDGYVASPYYQSLNGNVTTQQENASYSTGASLGRLQDTLSGTAIQYAGTGSLHNAYNNTFGDSAQYAVNRLLALTASVGHEDIYYGGYEPYRINDITWSGGVILTPNPDSSLAISYGHEDGDTSLMVNGVLAPTARSRIILRYSQGLETNQQQFQEAVGRSTVGPGGISVDPVTGAPLLLSNNALASQPGVYRTTQASITGSLLYARDVYSATIEQDTNKQVSGGYSGSGNSSGVSATLNWSHTVSDAISTNATAGYETQNLTGFDVANTTQDTLTLGVSVGYALSRTLSLNASYTFINTSNAVYGQAADQQIFIVGLHKSF